MNNFAGCIEGDQRHCNSETYVMSSDLKSRNSERFDARLHGAGINDEENAGQRDNTASAAFSVLAACSAAGGMGGACSLLDSRKPHAEEGMHTRSQQIFLAGAGWVALVSDAHARGAAVAQRLHSDTFGGGETRMQMRNLQRLGGQ